MFGFPGFRRTLGAGLLLLALVRPATAAVPASTPERLQALTRLPQVAFTSGLNFDLARGYALVLAEGSQAREVELIQRELVGTAADAPRLARLARLFRELGQGALAAQTLARSVALYREQGAGESRDVTLLAGYADALQERGQREEAERVWRRAVQEAPADWRARAGLARLLVLLAMQSLVTPGQRGAELPSLLEAMAGSGAERPGSAARETARRFMAEARAAAERAVEVTTNEPGPFLARGAVQTSQRFLEVVLGNPGTGEDAILRANAAIFHPEALPDLRQAARLAPRDVEAWGTLAMVEVLAEGFQRGVRSPEELFTRELWPTLPEGSRAAVRECLTRLEAIGQGDDPRPASAALGIQGLLQSFVLRDLAGGVQSLRQATGLDPANGNAWETLTFALAYSRQYPPMIAVCADRLKQRDTVRNRVLLAKAYERNDRLDAMLEEASAAQRRYPENLLANLTLGAALLRADRSEAGRARALQCLARATRLGGDAPPEEVATELCYQRGLYFGLSGQHAVARAEFRRLLERVPGHSEATEALGALEQAVD